jgi:hypothetical protein
MWRRSRRATAAAAWRCECHKSVDLRNAGRRTAVCNRAGAGTVAASQLLASVPTCCTSSLPAWLPAGWLCVCRCTSKWIGWTRQRSRWAEPRMHSQSTRAVVQAAAEGSLGSRAPCICRHAAAQAVACQLLRIHNHPKLQPVELPLPTRMCLICRYCACLLPPLLASRSPQCRRLTMTPH